MPPRNGYKESYLYILVKILLHLIKSHQELRIYHHPRNRSVLHKPDICETTWRAEWPEPDHWTRKIYVRSLHRQNRLILPCRADGGGLDTLCGESNHEKRLS